MSSKICTASAVASAAFSIPSSVAALATPSSTHVQAFLSWAARTFQQLEDFPRPTIAAIDGRCRGAASVLAVHCDFRIMGEGVEFFFPEVPAGMILGWGAISRLVALCGPSRTKQMVLFGEFLDAKTCANWGLADEEIEQRTLCRAGWEAAS